MPRGTKGFLEDKALDRNKAILLDQQEIRSHSSVLTNLRLDLVFRRIDVWKECCWVDPVFENIKGYFASIYTSYDIAFSVFDEDENEKIIELFKQYFELFFDMIDESKRNIVTGFKMIIVLDQVNRLIKGYLQKKQYFFKIGTVDIKGVERSIAVIERGGGFFGAGKKQVVKREEQLEKLNKIQESS